MLKANSEIEVLAVLNELTPETIESEFVITKLYHEVSARASYEQDFAIEGLLLIQIRISMATRR